MAKKDKTTTKKDNKKEKDTWEASTAKPFTDIKTSENPYTKCVKKETAKPKAKIKYTISGLSQVLKKEAVKMLMDGADIKTVAEKYGVAPSDISILP